jgi:polysaccharide pyruvyl transferase WcaK-like protein
MNILVEFGSRALNNVGDVAMLQVAVGRLRSLWPDAVIRVLSSAPESLARHCPGTSSVPANGRRKWLELSYLPGRLNAPRAVARRLAGTDRVFREHFPGLSDRLAVGRTKSRPEDLADLKAFLDVANSADLLVLSGGGYLADAFGSHAWACLDTLNRFQRRGALTAMVGQGIGPLRDPRLLAYARETFPRVELIALRESRAALPLLESIGFPRDRIRVTGDDAIELAYQSRPDRLGTFLGVNVRVSGYSNVGGGLLRNLRSALEKAAAGVGAELLPVPISSAAADSDVEVFRDLLSEDAADETVDGSASPFDAIRRVGRCRVVVTGSYHAGVFALSQGIPVVGLSRSDYYTDKFLGLADQFGVGCRLVPLDAPMMSDSLASDVRELWAEAESLRPELLAAAERQVREGHAAYELLGARIGRAVPLPRPAAMSEVAR